MTSSPHGSTTSGRPRRTTTTRSAGRTRWTRRTSGRNRSLRIGVARAMARSCTGPTVLSHRVRCGRSSITSSTTRPRSSRLPDYPNPDGGPRHPADAPAWRSMTSSFDDAMSPERHTTQYFEMFCNRGIYHQGWTAVTRHSTPWEWGLSSRRSMRMYGSSTGRTTGRRPTTPRPSNRGRSRTATLVMSRRRNTTSFRSMTVVSSVSTRTWPAAHNWSAAIDSCFSVGCNG